MNSILKIIKFILSYTHNVCIRSRPGLSSKGRGEGKYIYSNLMHILENYGKSRSKTNQDDPYIMGYRRITIFITNIFIY